MKHLSILCIFTLFTTSVAHAQVSTFADGIAVGGTSLSTGLILDVTGKIGASELCDANGANCSTVTNIYNAVTGGGIGGTGSGNYIPRFTNGTTLGNSVIRQSGDGNIGIGVAGMANSDTSASKLRVQGNILVNSRHVYFGTFQDLYGDNSSALYYDSNDSNTTQFIMRDKENTQYGRLYGTSNGTNFGLLEGDGHWMLRHIKDSGTIFYDNNENTFGIGQGRISGSYGTVTTLGTGKGNWEGYSINNNFVFMNNDNAADAKVGIYNDIDNEWMLYGQRNAWIDLRYNGGQKLVTESTGVRVVGRVEANEYCDESGANCLDASTLTNVNVGEDIYGSTQVGTPADTCGNGQSTFTCPVSATTNCTDRINVPYTYTCGGKGQNTCTGTYTNRYRSVDCKRARIHVNG